MSNHIVESLKREIENFTVAAKAEKVGRVIEVFDGIAKVSGLSDIKSSEMVTFPNGVSSDVLGRVVNALGVPIDGKGAIKANDPSKHSGPSAYPIERVAPGVVTRQSVDQPVSTGIKAIDAIIPVGRGQRELIIGDRQTGKTAIVIDAILNQKGQNMICVYVSIGQKDSKLRKLQ